MTASTCPTTATCSSSTSATCATASPASARARRPPSRSRTPTRYQAPARQVRRAVVALREGPLRPDVRPPDQGLQGVRRGPQAHRLVPRRGALRQPGLQLPVERELQLGPGDGSPSGPVWDFDLSGGTNGRAPPTPGLVHPDRRALDLPDAQDPDFSRRVKARWAELRPAVDQVIAQLPQASAGIGASADGDWQQWHVGDADLEWTRHARAAVARCLPRRWLTRRARG